MSRLTKIEPLYRGWTGATLPRSFFEPDALGLCGGVEYGFSSTTTVREQAVHYAQGSASTVLELEMGMIDRGAEVAWLSQCAPDPARRADACSRCVRPSHALPRAAQIRTRKRPSSRRFRAWPSAARASTAARWS